MEAVLITGRRTGSTVSTSSVGRRQIAAAFAAVVALALLGACTKDEAKGKAKPPVPVLAAVVEKKDVPYEIRAIGNIEAYASVAIKSQVTGQLARIHFKKGQFVKKGDLLFTIDPRQQQAIVRQAEAALERDMVQAENAREDEKRYAELFEKGYVARQQYDQARTNASALESVVSASRANLEAAKTQLSYYFIYAPLSGRVGDILVDEGNQVKANDDNKSMATINQIEPIFATFSVPEQHLASIKRYMSQHELVVDVLLDETDSSPERGALTFVDNAVDPSTGTIKLKATLKNSGHRLWPGQFVTVVLKLFVQKDAILVPAQAVQTGQSGQFVFVIKDDRTVEARPVNVARSYGTSSVMSKGLAAGERVVTDGQLRLVPGATVTIREPEKEAAPVAQESQKK